MYSIGRRVVITNEHSGYGGIVGTVIDRGFHSTNHRRHGGTKRKAYYLVEYKNGDVMLGGEDIRGADYCCENCSQWYPGTPHATHNVVLGDGSVDDTFQYCFLCTRGLR